MTAVLVILSALALTFVLARLGRERLALIDGEGLRFTGFNALRALAALGVVAGHTLSTSPLTSWPKVLVGSMATGVALFFVISGFLLYRPFAKALVDGSAVKIQRFAANRALRILPLYVLVVVVVFFATEAHPTQALLRLARALTFTGVYSGDDLVPVAWSLDDEVAFYLLLAALYLALKAWPRADQRIWLGAAVVTAMICASLGALALQPSDQSIVGGPITKFHLFGLGMLLGTVHARWPHFQLSPYGMAAAIAGVVGPLSVSVIAYDRHGYLFNPMCGLAFCTLVGIVAFSGPSTRLIRLISWKPLMHLGDVSYGIYLWHEPLHHVLFNAGLLSSSFAVAFLELATCTVALATGTYYLVEKPALRIKHRWVVSRTAVAPDDNRAPVQPKGHSPAFHRAVPRSPTR
ncbi:MAG TPA: acyltransferase [Candidatus Dormibacteraeota bacterium]